MKVTKQSKDFTPLYRGIIFGFDTESDTPTNVVVEIIDDTTDEIVATQQLRGVIAGEVNIAPYIAFRPKYRPTTTNHTLFCEAPIAKYRIRVDDEVSAPISVSANNELPNALPALVASMPRSRSISRTESDELLLVGEAGTTYTATIVADTGETLSLEYLSATGAAILCISTEDFESEINHLAVELYGNSVSLGSLHYTLRPRYNGSVRVAWLSCKGSIERYTFPVTAKMHYSSQKRVVEALENRRVASVATAYDLTLVSRYEPRETIQALSEIVCSKEVWMEVNGDWREVVVTSSELEYNLFGEPDNVRINICQWSREEGGL